MSIVVRLKDFRPRGRDMPTLVLIDMHVCSGADMPLRNEAIANCQVALKHARACGLPVAFTRQAAPPENMLASSAYPRWLDGFEPNRWDMVFDRDRPSCYASGEFREMADEIGGNYAIAGQFGELSCLSTAVDAFHRDHRPNVLLDAIAVRPYDDVPAGVMLAAATRILSLYAEPANTRSWMLATSRRAGARK
jgi:nicotinamidase-related amidase